MKFKLLTLYAVILISGSFLFTSCEKDPDLLSESITTQENENIDLKSTSSEENENQKLRHIILVEFIDEITYEQKKGFTSALLALKDSIDIIQDVEWGQDLQFYKGFNKGFTHCYLMTFSDLNDFISYLYHPALESFHIAWMPYVKNVLAFDYMSNDVETLFTQSNRKPWLRHIVLFNYNDEISDETKNQIREEYTALPQEIMHIRKMEWGQEMLLLGVNMDFTDGFLLSFSGFGSYFRYIMHPERIRFVKNYVEPNVEDILIFDYLIGKSTNKPHCPHPRYKGNRGKNH
jgi:hypothetical protein